MGYMGCIVDDYVDGVHQLPQVTSQALQEQKALKAFTQPRHLNC